MKSALAKQYRCKSMSQKTYITVVKITVEVIKYEKEQGHRFYTS